MSFQIDFSTKAEKDIEAFKKAGDKKILSKIDSLLEDILEDPYSGMGKPEPLKYNLAGYWSRRITKEHRLVYEILENDTIVIHSLKGHY